MQRRKENLLTITRKRKQPQIFTYGQHFNVPAKFYRAYTSITYKPPLVHYTIKHEIYMTELIHIARGMDCSGTATIAVQKHPRSELTRLSGEQSLSIKNANAHGCHACFIIEAFFRRFACFASYYCWLL